VIVFSLEEKQDTRVCSYYPSLSLLRLATASSWYKLCHATELRSAFRFCQSFVFAPEPLFGPTVICCEHRCQRRREDWWIYESLAVSLVSGESS